MAKLTAGQRARLSPSDFAGPGRSFPMPDKDHAKAALIDVGRSVAAGHITSTQAERIKARARAKLKQV